MKSSFLFVFVFLCFSATAQNNATIREYNKIFTTYPFSDPNPIPAFTNIYPYFRFDGFTDKPIQKEWKVVELENDFIKLTILPEVGGKIWSAIEKSTGKPFIYENHVVKFRDIAMRGPWTSGGIEANYGIMGHTPNCATPVDYITKNNEDGSVSCVIGVLDLLTRTHWSIEINLPKDKAYFTTKSFWYNPGSLSQPYYSWMNAGFKTSGNLQYIYRGNHYLGHEGEYSNWPINKQNGKDISYYDNNNFGGYKSYHVFGKYTDFYGAYWHDDDYGVARYSGHDEKPGKKIWIWGLSDQGMIWEKLLTDTDVQYTEMQSGRLFNQTADKSTFTPFKHKSFAPYSADVWTEYWFPVLKTKGFVEANEYGALNLKAENSWLKIYFSPVQKIDDTLLIKNGEKIIYQKKMQLTPLQTFADSLKVDTDSANFMVTLGRDKLIYKSNPDAYNLSRPLESPKDFDWNTSYGLYIQGKELMDEKNYAEAEKKLNESLQKDKNFLSALTKMAELMYRDMRYDEGLALAKRALSIDTYDGAANFYYGIINHRLGNEIDAKDGLDIAALSIGYRSAAYTALAQLYLKETNWDKAIEFGKKALDYDRYNIAALQSMAIAFRYLNNRVEAEQVLKTILSFDALNHFASFEKYLWSNIPENKSDFTSMIRNEQPQETYLELATVYYNNGCLKDAKKLLDIPTPNALINYWIAFLKYKQDENFTASLEQANVSSPAFIFPFRSEDEPVLRWAIKQSDNWRPKYFLALLYKDRNRIDESKKLFLECGNAPDFAPFYAARAEMKTGASDLPGLKKAIALDKDGWRYYKLLAEYYISQDQNEEALKTVEPFYKAHSKNYVIGMLYAKTLLLNHRYKECSQLLSIINILPFEGATTGRQLYREALLMQAVEQIGNKKYAKAITFIADAKKWPENLGVGKPYQEDIDERLEDWMNYLCFHQMKKEKEAQESLQKIIQFKPKIENTVSNFLPANDLVTAWALEKLNRKDEAVSWLKNEVAKYPDDKILIWCKNAFQNRKDENPDLTNSEVRILEALMQLQD
jgi:Tfp pilus assembly protein PilF